MSDTYLGMSAAQIGFAGVMRDQVHGPDRRVLNEIIHSQDRNQNVRKYGRNPFENNREWDEDAQRQLEEIAERHKFFDVLYDLRVTVFSHRVKVLMREMARTASGEERLRIWGEIEDTLDLFCRECGVVCEDAEEECGTVCEGVHEECGMVCEDEPSPCQEIYSAAKNTAVSAVHTFWADLLRRLKRAME